MSILFCTFVVEKENNSSPPETRTIGKYMLSIDFLTETDKQSEKVLRIFEIFLNSYTNYEYDTQTLPIGFRLNIHNCDIWRDANELTTSLLTTANNMQYSVTLYSLHFK